MSDAFDLAVVGNRTIEFVPAPVETTRIQLHYGDKITVEDACSILGASRPTINRLFQEGRLTRYCMKGRVYIPRAQILDVLEFGIGGAKGLRKKSRTYSHKPSETA
jgi:excisionase family DNA binding protein